MGFIGFVRLVLLRMLLEKCFDGFFSWLGEADEEMDEFEVDGFLVGSDEDEEASGEEDNSKQSQKKKKRKLLYFPTL